MEPESPNRIDPLSRSHRVLVVCASIFVAFTSFGTINAYGALFTAKLDTFEEGRSKTSMVHSLLVGTSYGWGVLGGYLNKRYSHTFVSAIESVLNPLGFLASIFATSVPYLIVSIGVVAGLGISFSYVSAVVVLGAIVPEKHRTTVLSLHNVMCGVGGIVLAYLFDWLYTNFGLRGTFLIFRGIAMNKMAATILFRGIKSVKTSSKTTDDIRGASLDTLTTVVGNAIETDTTKDRCDVISDDNEKGDFHSEQLHESLERKGANYTNKTATDDDDFDSRGPAQTMRKAKSDSSIDSIEKKQTKNRSKFDETIHHKRSERTMFAAFVAVQPMVIASFCGFVVVFQDVGDFRKLSTDQIMSCIAAYNVGSTGSRLMPAVLQVDPYMVRYSTSPCRTRWYYRLTREFKGWVPSSLLDVSSFTGTEDEH